MVILFNYQILQKLGESMHSEIFKVHVLNQPEKIQVLRKLKPQFNSATVKEYVEQQIDQLSNLSLAQSVIPSIINPDSTTFFLIQDFFPISHSLIGYTSNKLLIMKTFLRLLFRLFNV